MVAEASLFEHNESEHWYKLDGRRLESVTDVITDNRLLKTEFMTERGRERGTFVHKTIEIDLKYPGELDEDAADKVGVDLHNSANTLFAPGELMGFVRGARKAVEFFKFRPTMIEFPFYHPTHLYAGRIDAAGPGTLRGREKQLLVDWTLTTKLETKRIQLAAYAYGLPTPQLWARIGIELKQDGFKWKLFPLENLRKDMDDFLAGQRMLRLRQEIGIK